MINAFMAASRLRHQLEVIALVEVVVLGVVGVRYRSRNAVDIPLVVIGVITLPNLAHKLFS